MLLLMHSQSVSMARPVVHQWQICCESTGPFIVIHQPWPVPLCARPLSLAIYLPRATASRARFASSEVGRPPAAATAGGGPCLAMTS